MLDEAHRQYRPANYIIESWVDDLASVVQGTAEQCVEIAVNTGRKIGEAARKLKLRISPKSRVVFSRPGVAQAVAEELVSARVLVTAAGITKDLGLGIVACGSRRDVRQAAERKAV